MSSHGERARMQADDDRERAKYAPEKELRACVNGTRYRLDRCGDGWVVYADGTAIGWPAPYAQALTGFRALTEPAP